MRRPSSRAVRKPQGDHFTSFALGAAGISYTYWHAARLTGNPEHLKSADCWIRWALMADCGLLESMPPMEDPGHVPRFSFLYGSVGLYFVKALVADSQCAPRLRSEAIRRFIEEGRGSLEGPSDLYQGTAGCLNGTALLLHQIGDPRLHSHGKSLALHLTSVLEREQCRGGGLANPGLAHGTAGCYLSLLLWAAACETPLSAKASNELASFLAVTLAVPARFCPREERYASLCNGFAGVVLLALKAYQILGDPKFLDAARRAVHLVLDHPAAGADLCCGRAGAAYVCLMLAGVEPAGPWRRHAEELTLSTLLVDREEWTLLGLYGGEAAIPCLASSLLYGCNSGPPGLDFFSIPPTSKRSRRPPTHELM